MAQTRRTSSSRRRPRAKARPRRTTSTRRRTTRSKGKVFDLSRWSQKNTLIALGVILGLIILIALLQRGGVPISGGGGTGAGEVSSSAVYGKIIDAYPRVPPKGVIKLKSSSTGKVYTFYTGWKTRYSPVDRAPAVGDTAKIYYIYDRGYLKATYVRLY